MAASGNTVPLRRRDEKDERAEPPIAPNPEPVNEYSAVMQERMGTSLSYNHEDGMFYNRILPDMIVGSCPRDTADVDWLVEKENVKAIFQLQQNGDLAYFGIDLHTITNWCVHRGDVKHVRHPIADFNPHDLRLQLPSVVSLLDQTLREFSPLADEDTVGEFLTPEDQVITRRLTFLRPRDRQVGATEEDANQSAAAQVGDPGEKVEGKHPCIYIHCTAGMGRAPAAALAYMTWCRGWGLEFAHATLTASRACCPKLEAIRSASADILLGGALKETVQLHFQGGTKDTKVEVAGLDAGWDARLPTKWNARKKRHERTHELPIGEFWYKFVVDGKKWTHSLDHPIVVDGEHVNNFVNIRGGNSGSDQLRRELEAPGTELTKEQKRVIRETLRSGKLINHNAVRDHA